MIRNILLKVYIIQLTLIVFSVTSYGQCPSGSIGVSGAGCGCLSGCNLTSFGGPNCGSGTSGDCNAGYIPMSIDIDVPDGCEFTVQAQMQPRTGCSASGADGNCSNCDALKVDIPGGPKPNQFGGGNASISDSYTLVGPGTIRVSGAANRADEIITYQVSSAGATCPDCTSILPIELTRFNAEREGEYVNLTWITATERNNDYFTIEQSVNGFDFVVVGYMNGAGNSSSPLAYKLIDSSPELEKVSYYRLKQTDFDGQYAYSNIVLVAPYMKAKLIGYFNAMGQEVGADTKGLVILRYDDGSVVKIIR